jgi:hypothetical protein
MEAKNMWIRIRIHNTGFLFLDLIFSRAMFSNNLSQYSGDGVTVTLQEFAHFLRKEQAQPNTLDTVASIMRDFLQVCLCS